MEIKKALNTLIKYSSLALLALVLVVFGQASQAFKFNDDLRKHVINDWSGSDQSRAQIAEKFIATCIRGASDYTNRSIEDKPFDVYECGESVGAAELVMVIKKADGVLKTLAWPLSTIE